MCLYGQVFLPTCRLIRAVGRGIFLYGLGTGPGSEVCFASFQCIVFDLNISLTHGWPFVGACQHAIDSERD